MALTACQCRRPEHYCQAGWLMNRPSGPLQLGPASLSVHPGPAGRTGGADCLPAARRAGCRPASIFSIFGIQKKSPRPLARFLASAPYSSELFIVSHSLFHFFNFTFNPVGIPAVYSVGIPTVAILYFQSHSAWNTSFALFRFD
jgi:hypothetical protein